LPEPLVSVLLCHHGRRHLVHLALESYAQQDYENRELILVDSGCDPISDLASRASRCTYLYHSYEPKTLSEKRNAGIRVAKGEYIIHFDADDWGGPRRISDQVAFIASKAVPVAGYEHALWYDFVNRQASYYKGMLWGASMIYRRDYALAHPWDETKNYAEDGPFLELAKAHGGWAANDGGQNFVATMNDCNAHRVAAGTPGFWPFVSMDALPEGFRKCAGLN